MRPNAATPTTTHSSPDSADADAVLITTPDDVHFDPCMKAIDAGLHVLLEKPIAQRLDECRAIARRARERVCW